MLATTVLPPPVNRRDQVVGKPDQRVSITPCVRKCGGAEFSPPQCMKPRFVQAAVHRIMIPNWILRTTTYASSLIPIESNL